MPRRPATLSVTTCALACVACQSAPPPSGAGDPPIAAILDGEVITVDALDAWIKDELFRQQTGGNASRTYQFRKGSLDRLVERKVVEAEAARRGLDPDEFIRQEVEATHPVTRPDLAQFYTENRNRMGNARFDDVAPRIREYLEAQRAQEARQALVARAALSIELAPPRVEVSSGGPALGPPDAPVTIVEFGDFQCPFCRQASGLVHDLAQKYPEQVRIVYRHLPLDSIHPRARAAAEASACAADQGLFWEYHDRLFANSPPAISDDELRAHARELGADGATFDACFEKREHAAVVEADAAAAAELGVTGTPAFVVNGILLFGLPSEEAMDQLILSELEAAEGDPKAAP